MKDDKTTWLTPKTASRLLVLSLGLIFTCFFLASSCPTAHENQALGYSDGSLFRPMEHDDTSPIVAIVPHPDDEAFGFSGTLGAAIKAGAPARVYLLSDGEGAHAAKRWVARHQRPAPDLNHDGVVDKLDFAVARRTEFKNSMDIIGVPDGSVVCLGNAYGNPLLRSSASASTVAAFIQSDCAQNGFPLDSSTRVFTVAPQLGNDGTAVFFGEGLGDRKLPRKHQICASAAALLHKGDSGICLSNIYFFKVYAHAEQNPPPKAPIVFIPSDQGCNTRRRAIEQYAELGKKSAPRVYRGAISHKNEYAATLQDIRDAGFYLEQ